MVKYRFVDEFEIREFLQINYRYHKVNKKQLSY